MDRRITLGNFMLFSIVVIIFIVDNHHTTIYAIKDGNNFGSTTSSSSSNIIIQDFSLDSTLPLPFNSHIADALSSNNQQVFANSLIPFP
jgi:hypothetical protein